MSDETTKKAEETFPIAFPVKYWVIILGAIDQANRLAMREVEELRKQKLDPALLPEPMVTALAGPAIIRGVIVKELTERGVMKPEANEQFGIDRIMDRVRKYRESL